MTFGRVAVVNILRNRLRTTLTVLGVATAVVTFLLLRTVIWSYGVAAEFASKDRLVTRHKVSFVMSMPKRYAEQIREVPGVTNATWANWWGGKEPNHPNDFFMTIAVDPKTYFDVYDEMKVDAAQLAKWKETRRGAICGDLLAKKMDWKVGDKVRLESQIFAGDYQFELVGIYEATRKSVDRSQFLFHWDYMNESLPEGMPRDEIGWIISRVAPGRSAAETSVQIDGYFDEKEIQTLSQDERSFQAGFLAAFQAVLWAMNIVSIIILGVMILILGNTVSMGVRERTSEYGVLRAIGFLPRHLALLVVGEGMTLGLLGGFVGLGLGFVVVQLMLGRFIEENMGGMFPYFRLGTTNSVLAVVLAIVLATVASGIPAWQAARLKVVDALRRVA